MTNVIVDPGFNGKQLRCVSCFSKFVLLFFFSGEEKYFSRVSSLW